MIEEKRDYLKIMSTFPKKNETNSTSGANLSPYKKSGNLVRKMTSKMLNATNVTKRGIMRTNAPKLRPNIRRRHLKCEKWKMGILRKTLRRNPFVKFESGFLTWKKIPKTLLCDIGSFS